MNKINYDFINPTNAYQKVFVFPIHKMLKENKPVYEATRRAWKGGEWLQEEPLGASNHLK